MFTFGVLSGLRVGSSIGRRGLLDKMKKVQEVQEKDKLYVIKWLILHKNCTIHNDTVLTQRVPKGKSRRGRKQEREKLRAETRQNKEEKEGKVKATKKNSMVTTLTNSKKN